MTKLYAGDLVRIIATGELGIISAEQLGTEPRRFEVVLPPGPKEKQPTTLTCSEDELDPPMKRSLSGRSHDALSAP